MQSKDELGNRMKQYEAVETTRKLNTTLPIYARIDGRGFSKFTRHMKRPFDSRMTESMIDTTKYLVDQTHAAIGFVQSDEISLVWTPKDSDDRGFFAGKIQKMVSVLASMSASRFVFAYRDHFDELPQNFPHFDCRVINMPSLEEAVNMLLWRELDARKNAVSMAAHHYFGNKKIFKKSTKEMQTMLSDIGQDIKNFPVAFTTGTWIKRETVQRLLTDEELAAIPSKHQPAPNVPVSRTQLASFNLPADFNAEQRFKEILKHAQI